MSSRRKYKRRLTGKTKHHIQPLSRGGKSNLENIAGVPDREHKYYHALFLNQTPEEIIKTLVNHYWNGNWQYVQTAYQNRKI